MSTNKQPLDFIVYIWKNDTTEKYSIRILSARSTTPVYTSVYSYKNFDSASRAAWQRIRIYATRCLMVVGKVEFFCRKEYYQP